MARPTPTPPSSLPVRLAPSSNTKVFLPDPPVRFLTPCTDSSTTLPLVTTTRLPPAEDFLMVTVRSSVILLRSSVAPALLLLIRPTARVAPRVTSLPPMPMVSTLPLAATLIVISAASLVRSRVAAPAVAAPLMVSFVASHSSLNCTISLPPSVLISTSSAGAKGFATLA